MLSQSNFPPAEPGFRDWVSLGPSQDDRSPSGAGFLNLGLRHQGHFGLVHSLLGWKEWSWVLWSWVCSICRAPPSERLQHPATIHDRGQCSLCGGGELPLIENHSSRMTTPKFISDPLLSLLERSKIFYLSCPRTSSHLSQCPYSRLFGTEG